jgi:hypothetical protein
MIIDYLNIAKNAKTLNKQQRTGAKSDFNHMLRRLMLSLLCMEKYLYNNLQ